MNIENMDFEKHVWNRVQVMFEIKAHRDTQTLINFTARYRWITEGLQTPDQISDQSHMDTRTTAQTPKYKH